MRRILFTFSFLAWACTFTCSFVGSYPSIALATSSQKVDTDLKAYDDHVTTLNEPFNKIPVDMQNKEWVKQKLQHMVDVDQYMRLFGNVVQEHHYSSDETKVFWAEFMPRWRIIDTANTADLKKLLKIYGWFKISEFGKIADENAWLLTQHADLEPEFQKEVLGILVTLLKTKETSPSNYAYLFDRVAVSSNDQSKRKPQRYGTQGHCTGPGTWVPDPNEDPPNLDKRRQSVGLKTEAEYIAGFKNICK